MGPVLVVEDEFAIADTVRSVLAAEGYSVAVAQDGKEALELMTSVKPALVLSDCMMPGMDGYQLLEAIRATPHFAKVPVVLMSAVPPRARPAEARWNAFLRKPFGIDGLIEVVRAHLPP